MPCPSGSVSHDAPPSPYPLPLPCPPPQKKWEESDNKPGIIAVGAGSLLALYFTNSIVSTIGEPWCCPVCPAGSRRWPAPLVHPPQLVCPGLPACTPTITPLRQLSTSSSRARLMKRLRHPFQGNPSEPSPHPPPHTHTTHPTHTPNPALQTASPCSAPCLSCWALRSLPGSPTHGSRSPAPRTASSRPSPMPRTRLALSSELQLWRQLPRPRPGWHPAPLPVASAA